MDLALLSIRESRGTLRILSFTRQQQVTSVPICSMRSKTKTSLAVINVRVATTSQGQLLSTPSSELITTRDAF